MPRKLLLLALLALLVTSLSSCASPQRSEEPAGESTEPPRYQRAIRTALTSPPETLDTVHVSGLSGGRLAVNLFEGLMTPAQTTEGAESLEDLVEPGVAASWDVSKDGTTYTFHLRDDARWSDGEPVTAGDFVFAWKRVLTPGESADFAPMLYVIDGAKAYHEGDHQDWSRVAIEAPDDHTLVVRLEHPAPYFLEMVSFYTFYPQPEHVVERHGNAWVTPENIVTNGAYTLSKAGATYKLKKNAEYWDADSVAFDNASFEVIRDRREVIETYERGDLDFTSNFVGPEFDWLYGRDDHIRSPMLGVYFLRINVSDNESLLADPTFRMALKLSIDRDKLVDEVAGSDRLTPLGTYVPPGVPGYERPAGLEYSPDRARALLDKAAGDERPSLDYLYNQAQDHENVAGEVHRMWQEELGLDVTRQPRDWRVYLQQVDTLDYEIARSGWIGDFTDPMTFLQMFETGNGNNDTGWSDAEYDALLGAARGTSDPDRRMTILRDAEKLLLTKGPVIPIYQYVSHHLVSDDIEGFEPHMRDTHLLKYIRPAD